MSRFKRPKVIVKEAPKPPKALVAISNTLAVVQGLVSLVARVQSFNLGAFLMNAGMAAAKAQLASQRDRIMKMKLLNRPRVKMAPDNQLGFDPTAAVQHARYVAEVAKQAQQTIADIKGVV